MVKQPGSPSQLARPAVALQNLVNVCDRQTERIHLASTIQHNVICKRRRSLEGRVFYVQLLRVTSHESVVRSTAHSCTACARLTGVLVSLVYSFLFLVHDCVHDCVTEQPDRMPRLKSDKVTD